MENVFVKTLRSTLVGDLLGTLEGVDTMRSKLQLLDDLNKLIYTGDLDDCVGHLENDLLLEHLEILLCQLRHGVEPDKLQVSVPVG